MSSLTLEDIDSVSEAGAAPTMPGMSAGPGGLHNVRHMNSYPQQQPPMHPPMPSYNPRGGGDNLGPLPPPVWSQTVYNSNPYGASFNPVPPMGHVKNYARPAPYLLNQGNQQQNETASYVSMPGNGAESVHSGSGECE